jgi:hypothetical protein
MPEGGLGVGTLLAVGMIAKLMTASGEHALRARDLPSPAGTLSVYIKTDVDIEAEALVGLAIDLDQLLNLHPRLAEARWLDEPAKIGSRAEIVVTMPTSLNVLRPIIGATRGVCTLVEYQPDRSVRYAIDSPRVTGNVQLVVNKSHATRSVEIRGSLHAKASLARLASIPFTGAAEFAVARAARRTLARAVDVLSTREKYGMARGPN